MGRCWGQRAKEDCGCAEAPATAGHATECHASKCHATKCQHIEYALLQSRVRGLEVRIKRIILQIAAYTLYAIVAFVVFLYVTFPYDLLQQRLVEWVSQAGVQLTLARLRPAFPPGVQAHDIRLVMDQLSPSATIVHIATLRVQPEWLALLSRKTQVHFV